MRHAKYLAAAAFILAAGPASALSITNDFSALGTVYDAPGGFLSNVFSAGAVDVTTAFKADANYAASILGKAIGAPFSTTISITLADLSFESAVGDSGITSLHSNGLPASSDIRVDNSGTVPIYVDATPANNSEFSFVTTATTLGGGTVNVSRFGQAIVGSDANNKYDLVTLFLHEMEHSIAYSSGIPPFLTAAGPVGDPNRQIVVPTSLTGFTSDFSIPIVPGSSHIDGVVDNGLFNNTVVAEPGFDVSQRALITGVEIYGACVVDGCTASQVNTDPYTMSSVPLPASGTLMLSGLFGLAGFGVYRRKGVRKADQAAA